MLLDKFLLSSSKFIIVLALIMPWLNTVYSYLLIIFLAIIILPFLKFRIPYLFIQKTLYILPLLIFLSWVYGAISGLINNAYLPHIFTNFAGLAFYLIFYFLYSIKISNKFIISTVFTASCIVLLRDALLLIFSFINTQIFIIDAKSISDYRTAYDPAVLYFSPFILAFLIQRFGSLDIERGNFYSSYMTNSLLIFCLSIVYLFLAFSKGLIAIYGLILFASILFALKNLINNFKINIHFLFFILISILATFFFTDIFFLILNSYNSMEQSNEVRSIQLDYLINEITFTGSGLGSGLQSGYIRDVDSPYGFELTYLNLVHKLGFASIPIFLSYLLVIFWALFFLIYKDKFWSGIFILGAMTYTILGYGNPILFSPNFVLIHVMCIIVILNNYRSL